MAFRVPFARTTPVQLQPVNAVQKVSSCHDAERSEKTFLGDQISYSQHMTVTAGALPILVSAEHDLGPVAPCVAELVVFDLLP